MRALWRLLTAVLLAGALAACSTITLVPAYDEQIDSGLTSLYADTSGFVDRMVSAAGTEEGSYARNVSFYDDVQARVDALTVRAEAHRVLNNCPSTKLVAQAFANARIPEDVREQIGALAKDSCQVTLLRLIRDGYGTMRRIHELRGPKGLPPEARAQFIEAGVGAQLRAAITVEVAKRAG